MDRKLFFQRNEAGGSDVSAATLSRWPSETPYTPDAPYGMIRGPDGLVFDLNVHTPTRVQNSGRQRPGDLGYLSAATTTVQQVNEFCCMRASKGTRVYQPDRMAGGSALKWLGESKLTTHDTPGATAIVVRRGPGARDPDVVRLARLLYARPADRIGVTMDATPGRAAAQVFSVDEDHAFPPYKSAMGAALMVRRNLCAQLASLGEDPTSLAELTIKDWGLRPEDADLLKGNMVKNLNPLRAVITGKTRHYASRSTPEVNRGLGVIRIATARDSLPDGVNFALNHAALEVLMYSVTSLVLRRNPEFARTFWEARESSQLGFALLQDALCRVTPPSPLEGVLRETNALTEFRADLAQQERAEFIGQWQAALVSDKELVASRLAAERDDEDELILTRAAHKVSSNRELPVYAMRRSSNAVIDYAVVSSSRFHAAIKSQEYVPTLRDAQRGLPLAPESHATGALRIILYASLVKSRQVASAIAKGYPPGPRDMGRIARDLDKKYLPILATAVPQDCTRAIRSIMTARGVQDVETALWNLADGTYVKGEPFNHMEYFCKGILNRSNVRLIYWIMCTAKAVCAESRNLGPSLLTSYGDMSVEQACMHFMDDKLKSWSATLRAPTRSQRDWVELQAAEGMTAWDTEIWADGLADGDTNRRRSNPDVVVEDSKLDWTHEVTIPDPMSSKQAWFHHLALRQMLAVMLDCCRVVLTGAGLTLSFDESRMLVRLKRMIRSRKANLVRRYEKLHHLKQTRYIAPQRWDDMCMVLPEPDYTPATCKISLETFDEQPSLELVAVLMNKLSRGYFVVKLDTAFRELQLRMSLIVSDMHTALDKFLSEVQNATADDVLDESDVVELPAATSVPMMRHLGSQRVDELQRAPVAEEPTDFAQYMASLQAMSLASPVAVDTPILPIEWEDLLTTLGVRCHVATPQLARVEMIFLSGHQVDRTQKLSPEHRQHFGLMYNADKEEVVKELVPLYQVSSRAVQKEVARAAAIAKQAHK